MRNFESLVLFNVSSRNGDLSWKATMAKLTGKVNPVFCRKILVMELRNHVSLFGQLVELCGLN